MMEIFKRKEEKKMKQLDVFPGKIPPHSKFTTGWFLNRYSYEQSQYCVTLFC
jgi:hypothetical protein